jgi:putative CocE/NonD family hydrolase
MIFSLILTVITFSAWGQQPLREALPQDDFELHEVMIPMRDGINLYTIIIIPKNVTRNLPIIIDRTPYDASERIKGTSTGHISVLLGNRFLLDDCIYVFQDIRGRFKSEGENLLYRVPRGNFNQTETDETTDAWDTIDWLIKNINSNGRVGIWGTSYPGWLTLAALRDPHPALAVAVPFNPVVDVWKADDWFHWGAFRMTYAFDYIYSMQTRSDESTPFPYSIRDMYTWTLERGSAINGISPYLDDRHEMWSKLMRWPGYGPYWQDVAADQWFNTVSRFVPTMHVHGFWDQEDIYGAPAVYEALEKYDSLNNLNFFVAGPWYHGQHWDDGSNLGHIKFEANTSKQFREDVLSPFLRHYLLDEGTELPAPVCVFETGTNRWRSFDQWPPAGKVVRLYLQPHNRLTFTPPVDGPTTTEFISDPEKPIPYAPRPNFSPDYDNPVALAKWRRWLVEDQRFVDGRPDVATWVSEVLSEPITIRGPIVAYLIAETTGTDADWVVKLIDVYPEDDTDVEMSGYQLMISADIFRGRYRESFEEPHPIIADKALPYTMQLPHVNHTITTGHRLMVQIQSTWFPLYDRNPQTYVESIMSAPEDAYRKQQHRIHHSPEKATYLEFNIDRNR